jgi:hypothetical protein
MHKRGVGSLGVMALPRRPWSREDEERAIDNEDKQRAARLSAPSTSESLNRCQCCREWSRADATGHCSKCGALYEPAALVGLARAA